MRGTVTAWLGGLAFLVSSGVAEAQVPRPPASQVEAIGELEPWVGEWKGTGWAMLGPEQRMEFVIAESVRPKIQGSILLVEGRGTVRDESGEELVTHEALAVLSYDPASERYRWRTYDLRGAARDTEFRLTEKGAEWGFRDEERGALLRFTIELESDRWYEVGEVSVDEGNTWYRILEMTLARESGQAGGGGVTQRPSAKPPSAARQLSATQQTTAAQRPLPDLAFRDVRVFDGERILEPATVVVKAGWIAAVGPDVAVPDGAVVVDGAGRTLLPGLIDAHTHTFDPSQLHQALAFGVTTQLDMATDPVFAARMREAQREGGAPGRADLLSAGFPATAPGGHGTQFFPRMPTIDDPREAGAFVEARMGEGSDWIKVIRDDGRAYGISWPTLSEETLGAVIEAARAQGLRAVVHVGTLADARAAVGLGADGLVHLFTDSVPDAGFGALVARHGAFVIPTLTVLEGVTGTPSGAGLVEDPQLRSFLGPAAAASLTRAFPVRSEDRSAGYAAAAEAVRQLGAAGAPLLAGSDAPNPGTTHGASLHRELELLVQAGLSPLQALAAATSIPAAAFGLADRGRIAPGLRADLVLVEGDPTRDILHTRAIAGVWKAGVPFDRDAYRREVAAAVAAAEAGRGAAPPPGSESGLVSDFDAGEPAAAFGSGWVVSTDAVMGGSSTAEMEVVAGGAEGTPGALEVRGEVRLGAPFPWAGVMFFPGPQPFAPADLSAFRELSFRATGEGRAYRVLVFSESGGMIPAEQTFVAGPEWERHAFPLSAFGGIDGRDIQGIFFGAGPEPGAFRFRIDEVRLE